MPSESAPRRSVRTSPSFETTGPRISARMMIDIAPT